MSKGCKDCYTDIFRPLSWNCHLLADMWASVAMVAHKMLCPNPGNTEYRSRAGLWTKNLCKVWRMRVLSPFLAYAKKSFYCCIVSRLTWVQWQILSSWLGMTICRASCKTSLTFVLQISQWRGLYEAAMGCSETFQWLFPSKLMQHPLCLCSLLQKMDAIPRMSAEYWFSKWGEKRNEIKGHCSWYCI